MSEKKKLFRVVTSEHVFSLQMVKPMVLHSFSSHLKDQVTALSQVLIDEHKAAARNCERLPSE
jgi:hypothetical protein